MPDWIVLIPPLLVIGCVLATRRMIVAFLLGIVTSALIVSKGNIDQAVLLSAKHLWKSAGLKQVTSLGGFMSSWNLLIFIFLICLGILIVLLSESGAAEAYVKLISQRVKTRKEAQSASLLLSLFFFIDDYFSALTVGSVMRPLAYVHNIHPVKLAFLTTAMATPITIISPISSWVGEIVLQLKQVGIGPEGATTVIVGDPYTIFIYAIPYLLYPLLVIAGTWYIVLRNISYGPMQKYDRLKSTTHEFITDTGKNGSLGDFLMPLIVLIAAVCLTMLYTGDSYLFGGTESISSALKNGSVHKALFAGGIASLFFGLLYFGIKGTIPVSQLMQIIRNGSTLMFPSILMLICAWSLGSILKNDLKTGAYIATVLSSFMRIEWFPLMCFLCSALIALMIGSAWATIGLMFPIMIDMLQKLLSLAPNTPLSSIEFVLPLIGATLSGAVMGVHLSVIADNSMMSSVSTGANHLEHVKTMAWYLIPIGCSAAAGFACIGFLAGHIGLKASLALGLSGSILLMGIILEACQYFFHATDK
jgi:tetracycline resistance efflux pump